MHFFCLECAKRNADNELGNFRYKLTCMSGDVCAASFSRTERHRFLDEKTLKALERMESQAEVKQAGLEGLVNCPFCDFAAICPPVEVDREFRCQNGDCEKVSCRICRSESHIPLSCDEWKKENRISERHVLEEARTAALLKKCPKCNVQILKEHGCNRLTCPCGVTMCDFCGKDITGVGYGHFKGEGPRGASQTCPTYDDLTVRRRHALKEAQATALEEVRARNPELNLKDIDLDFRDDDPSGPQRPLQNEYRRDDFAFLGEPVNIRPAVPPPNYNPRLPVEWRQPPQLGGAYRQDERGRIQHERNLPPAFYPPIVPETHNPVHHRHRRPRHAIMEAEFPPIHLTTDPLIPEGFAAATRPAYQFPFEVPPFEPLRAINLIPPTFAQPPSGHHDLSSHRHRHRHRHDEFDKIANQMRKNKEIKKEPGMNTERTADLMQKSGEPVEDRVRGHQESVENRVRRHQEPVEDRVRRHQELADNRVRGHQAPVKTQLLSHKEHAEDWVRRHKEPIEDRIRRHKELVEFRTRRQKDVLKNEARK